MIEITDIKVEPHCHTLFSSHAYSTLYENLLFAKKKGLEALALTDHGPAMPDGGYDWHFRSMASIPDELDGVKIIKGVEVNLVDFAGGVDLDNRLLSQIDLVIASFHNVCCKHGSVEDHTRAYLAVANNPHIDIIGHCGTPDFAFDYEAGVKAFAEKGKIVEINSHSFSARGASRPNCLEIAKLCKKYACPVVVSSDAHFCTEVGDFGPALEVLGEVGFDQDLVLNTSYEKLMNHLKNA